MDITFDEIGFPTPWALAQRVECPECEGRARVHYRKNEWYWVECENGHGVTGMGLETYDIPWTPSGNVGIARFEQVRRAIIRLELDSYQLMHELDIVTTDLLQTEEGLF